jgi:type IV secretion system protein VirD4
MNADRPSPDTRPPGSWSLGETLFMGAVLAAGAVAVACWAGAALAAFVAGRSLRASLADALVAAVHLPQHLWDPASAWRPPAGDALPGPFVYWPAQLLVLAGVAAAVLGVRRLLLPGRSKDGLGVDRSAHFAARADLRRLVVPGPTAGRIVLGRSNGVLLATEERTGVCVVGPSQSGKTTGLCVPALLELGEGGGAVIAASVKGDLHKATWERRARLGDVKVFDPTRVVPGRCATWSPLRPADTVTGAQAAARSLVEVASRAGLKSGDFWMDATKELLWPLFYVAANTGGSMADVVRWVSTHDRPVFNREGRLAREGEVTERLKELRAQTEGHEPSGEAGEDQPLVQGRPVRPAQRPARGTPPDETSLAINALTGIWGCDERTRSDIYTTARTVIEAWSDPLVAQAAEGCEITPEWLLSGDHTLYIVAPARDQKRLRLVFASLVADLVDAAFEVATRKGGELDNRLLVLLDEAANICPVNELPMWCSTCASHGITLLTVWQDRSQQRQRYGPEGAETIWNNSGAKLILSGLADRATAEVTTLLGEEEIERATTSTDSQGRRTVSTHTTTRRLISEDSLRRQQPAQALLIYKDLPPVRLALRPWQTDENLRALKEDR